MKDGFVQALEILEVVKQSIKDKKMKIKMIMMMRKIMIRIMKKIMMMKKMMIKVLKMLF
jgi:hypothetical protein